MTAPDPAPKPQPPAWTPRVCAACGWTNNVRRPHCPGRVCPWWVCQGCNVPNDMHGNHAGLREEGAK